ncbi:YggS family pyridoxal phosphate-dependent enzyme [soil metagenome]
MNEDELTDQLRSRLEVVEGHIDQACRRSGRPRSEVTLVAVTKTVQPEIAARLATLGIQDMGESRPQELWRKSAELPSSVRWHMIGHLQRNKIERTLPLVQFIHAVDSSRLLDALEQEAGKQGRRVPVLLEINASREAAKQGWRPEDVPALADCVTHLQYVEVRGLMTMAAYDADPENCRPTFREARQVLEQLRATVGPGHALDQLSMGMSNDYEVAIEEGATLIRLGSVLFEGIGASQS